MIKGTDCQSFVFHRSGFPVIGWHWNCSNCKVDGLEAGKITSEDTSLLVVWKCVKMTCCLLALASC